MEGRALFDFQFDEKIIQPLPRLAMHISFVRAKTGNAR
jgi:hypothetical protein